MSDTSAPRGEIRNPFFARVYDRFLSSESERMRDVRRSVLANLHGRVVEVGAGNGPNFTLYPESVSEIVAVEPEPYLRERAAAAAARSAAPIRVVAGVADALPVGDGSADAVVCCLVLCSVPDQASALREVRRVLRNGGELRLLEHVGALNPVAKAALKTAEVTFWRRAFGNCHPTRDTLAAVKAAGFDVAGVDRRVMQASPLEPPLPYIVGVAS